MNTNTGEPTKGRTNTVTPEHKSIVNIRSNLYNALASDSESNATSLIAEEAYLPGPITYSSDSDSNSESDMSGISKWKGDSLTKDTLQELMEELNPGCTTVKTKHSYTDISNFQITMGNALARVPAPY